MSSCAGSRLLTKHRREKKPNTTDLPMSECSQVCWEMRVYLTQWSCHGGRAVNGITNGADGSDDVGLVETDEAIDPWPDIDFEWRLEAQLCVDKAKTTISIRSRTVLWLLKRARSEAQRCDKTEKYPHIAWLCHANQRRRRFKEIYQTSCFSKTIVMNMTPPSYPRINRRTDISKDIVCRLGNFAELCLL